MTTVEALLGVASRPPCHGWLVRLDLAQADDARRFGATASAASGSSLASADIATPPEARAAARARRLAAALLQAPGEPVPLAEQMVTLFAVQRGFADRVEPEQVAPWLRGAMAHVRSAAPGAMQEVGRTGLLTAEAEASITNALRTFVYVPARAAA
ncbi:hypothetical protein HYH03_009244 [Edaphochlamys debaryana]|uniref:ATP synthase alpha subunit C-terminal domain-containing protein n=1 Tax=Edaphochlamys debaryana TaxID=47281 RepID=A0A836BYR1_9CHLO|nr:hypothetical protein HYH03_009244 [Edaphochlamys debaryana]|eukprot:KAG2492583.1 hypothetical protein HYH03_009244 [Edaphochlamys debaryana]